ncbi:hypothetical protein F5Y08DRAFT_302785 [Xylaria arbuscula]|nr:hypothetical protein F5Y08DRAFT_302785 [Xylaria arbuscula]
MVFYRLLLGFSLWMGLGMLGAVVSIAADYDYLCGFPFPGPRLPTHSDQCRQNEALEMQPIYDEGLDSYGYRPVDGEGAIYDSPPPYSALSAPSNSIMTNNTMITDDALAPALHHVTNDKPAGPQERARSPTGL